MKKEIGNRSPPCDTSARSCKTEGRRMVEKNQKERKVGHFQIGTAKFEQAFLSLIKKKEKKGGGLFPE